MGSDKRSVAIQVDLDSPVLDSVKRISGSFMVSVPSELEVVETGLLEDKKGSIDENSGIRIDICGNWPSGGRLYDLGSMPDTGKIQRVQVFDGEGNELEMLKPVESFLRKQMRIIVQKEKGTPFRLRLTMAKELVPVRVPFLIEDVVIVPD